MARQMLSSNFFGFIVQKSSLNRTKQVYVAKALDFTKFLDCQRQIKAAADVLCFSFS